MIIICNFYIALLSDVHRHRALGESVLMPLLTLCVQESQPVTGAQDGTLHGSTVASGDVWTRVLFPQFCLVSD